MAKKNFSGGLDDCTLAEAMHILAIAKLPNKFKQSDVDFAFKKEISEYIYFLFGKMPSETVVKSGWSYYLLPTETFTKWVIKGGLKKTIRKYFEDFEINEETIEKIHEETIEHIGQLVSGANIEN